MKSNDAWFFLFAGLMVFGCLGAFEKGVEEGKHRLLKRVDQVGLYRARLELLMTEEELAEFDRIQNR